MLARTPATLVYLTAIELGITERERAGLIEVRDDLASGKIKHAPIEKGKYSTLADVYDNAGAKFSMNDWANKYEECGTCHCIGGFLTARGIVRRGQYSSELTGIFYPDHNKVKYWDELTPAQAVRAIDHFLAGAGAECWPMALADIPAA